jgi:hypothetical protein
MSSPGLILLISRGGVDIGIYYASHGGDYEEVLQ